MSTISMAVNNDAFAKANRASRSAGGDDRSVEILLPLGMDLDEDKDGIPIIESGSITHTLNLDSILYVFILVYVSSKHDYKRNK